MDRLEYSEIMEAFHRTRKNGFFEDQVQLTSNTFPTHAIK